MPGCGLLADDSVCGGGARSPDLALLPPRRTGELPDRPTRHAAEEHAVVVSDVGDRARPAPSLEVPRRREDARADEPERSRDQPVVRELSDPERQIEALVHEINDPLRERNLDLHLRIAY